MILTLGAPAVLLSRSGAPFVRSCKQKAIRRAATSAVPLRVFSTLRSLYEPLEDEKVSTRKTGHYSVEIYWDLDNMYWGSTRGKDTLGMSAEIASRAENELVITTMMKRLLDIGTTLANKDFESVVLRLYGE
eukprot:5080926-Pyramimonas_sp.AAC.1